MFSKKYKILTVCDGYLNIYDKCNIGCNFCKFNKATDSVKLNEIDLNEYRNKKILVCYSVDPYPFGYNKKIVPNIIKQLHNNGCNIVFLTRRAECLKKDITIFNKNDYIGISLSENSNKDSSMEEVVSLFKLAREYGIKTWISLEPIETLMFAENIINIFKDKVDFIRVGKNDLKYSQSNWENIKSKIRDKNIENVFVKE